MIRILFAAVMVLGLGTVLGADEAKKEEPKAKTVVVPFELLKSGHMAVNVKVNGKGPFLLIFDTGAPITLVNNKLAKEAKLLDNQPKPLFSLFGSMGEVKLKNLEIGDAKTSESSAIVMDHPTVEAISKALKKEIHGLVGFPFFAPFKMTLDYKAKTLTLTPNGYKSPSSDLMKAMTESILSGAKAKTLAPSAQWGIVCGKGRDDDDDGVDVKAVVAGSAADKAGIKKGDRLLTLDGRWTDTMMDLYEAAGYVKAGTTVKVKVARDGKVLVLNVTPAKGM